MSFVEEEFQELMTIESSNSLSGVNSNDIYIYLLSTVAVFYIQFYQGEVNA